MDTVVKYAYALFLKLDSVIYNFIRYIYSIFLDLTKINLFGMDDYNDIVARIYIILGLVMLFVLAYSLLKAVINPDNFAKGETSFPKLIQNVVVSLVIIAMLPTIFGLAFNVQSALLNQGTLTKIILSNDNEDGEKIMNEGGNEMSFYVFQAFFGPDESKCDDAEDCSKEKIESSVGTLAEVDEKVLNGASFGLYSNFADEVSSDDGKINYSFPLSTIAGIFVLWVLLNFCFDMALRTIKLAFYQIIAPIPVICRVIPGGKLKDVFSKWVQQVISLFLEVFIRIGSIAFGVKMINIIVNKFNDGTFNDSLASNGTFSTTLIKALIIMALVMFIKKAPELITKLFGLDTGGMKLGLREKLAAGGGLMAASAIGSGVGLLAKKAVATGQNVRNAKSFGGKVKALGAGVVTGGAAVATGMLRGGYKARGAKNFTDVRKASTGGVDATMQTGEKIRGTVDRYKAEGKILPGVPGAFHNVGVIASGFASDKWGGVKSYLGLGDSFDALQGEKNTYKPFLGEDDKVGNNADDLITREAISQNAALTLASGGPYMSLDAMHEHLDIMRKSNVQSLIGRSVKDFDGNEMVINSELDYSNYLANLKNQLSTSERNLKKYLKVYAFQENGLEKMQINIAEKLENYQASHRDEILKSVAQNTSIVASAGSPCIRSLDDMKMELDTISFNAVNGKTVKDFNGNDIVINNQAQYNDYINKLQTQYNDAKDKVSNYLNTQAMEGAQLNFGGGDMQRWNKIVSSQANVNNLLKENLSVIAALYEKYMPAGTPPLTELSGPDAFDAFDNLITMMKNRNIDIDAEFEKLQRANKSGGNDNK